MSANDDGGARDARAIILARRAKYVAMALAGAGIAACSSTQVCLDIALPEDSGADAADASADGTDTAPQPCLSPAIDTGTRDDGVDTSDAGDTSDAADTTPQPCLSPTFDGGAG